MELAIEFERRAERQSSVAGSQGEVSDLKTSVRILKLNLQVVGYRFIYSGKPTLRE